MGRNRERIKTPRLILQPQSLHDFDRYFAMSKDPEVMAFIGDGSIFHWTREVALEKFKAQLAARIGEGLGTRAVYRQKDSLYLGWCAIAPSKFLDHLELGYRFCRDAWGQGYATEAAAAMIEQAMNRQNLNSILACTHPDNMASIRILEKLGFIFAYPKFSNPIGKDIPVYRIDRHAFSAVWLEMNNSGSSLVRG